MKEKEIVKKYNLKSFPDFMHYVRTNKLHYSETLVGGITIDDDAIDGYVSSYLEAKRRQVEEKEAAEKQKEEAAAREAEEKECQEKATAEMLITSGFNFEGYTITKYSEFISCDSAVSVDRGLGGFANVEASLRSSLSLVRNHALRRLKEAAYALGCNAVIGVDYDYLTLAPETASYTGGTVYMPYVFCVTANGTAVVIEKTKE